MKRIGLILIIGFGLFGCDSEKAGTSIVVTTDVDLPMNGSVVLFSLTESGFNAVDTFKLEDAQYATNVEIQEEGFYRVDIARMNYVNLILTGDEDVVEIDLSGSKKDIKGSESSSSMLALDEKIQKYQRDTQQLRSEAMTAQQSGDAQLFSNINDQFMAISESYQSAIMKTVENEDGSLVALYGLNYLDSESEIDFFDEVISAAEKKRPNHFWTQELRANLEEKRKLAIGQPAPDFRLEQPDGTSLTLSDLKGKYVLIDFWAAWCRPCRQENPNVVRAYQKYGGPNFEILGVSLDRTREAWLKAIADDGLTWKHVSDLQYYNSKAALLYNISAIPATYLIDPDGNILDKNLRGPSLDSKLEELFGE